jgi:hypothetical protein
MGREIMGYVKYIESLIDEAEKKVHAGEWLRIEVVRMLMSQLCLRMLEDAQRDLRAIKRDVLKIPDMINGEEEE